MSGHSKWAQIKRSKAKIDAQRGAVFTKIAREIYVAVKLGGPDPSGNFRLKTCIEKAKAALMPIDNIKRAIQRGSGDGASENYEDIRYEGYGPGGTAIIINTLTDNRNRTAGDIRSYFIKCDGNLGETGCVGWMFSEKGIITVEGYKKGGLNFDDLFLFSADSGAEDVIDIGDDCFQVISLPSELEKISQNLEKEGYIIRDSNITMVPENNVLIEDESIAKKVIKLIDLIENHDDVQDVYSNFELSENLMYLVE